MNAAQPDPSKSRGMLKPGLQWKTTLPSTGAPKGSAAQAVSKQKGAGLGSNSLPQSQYSLEQLKKMAASRGISVEKLVAQMIQQYLKESGGAE